MAETDLASSKRRAYIEALDAHIKARIEHNEAFLRHKMMATPDRPITDKQAEAMAISDTRDAVTRTEHELRLARLDFEQVIYGKESTETATTPIH